MLQVLEEIRKSSQKFSKGESVYRGVSKCAKLWKGGIRFGKLRLAKYFRSDSVEDELAAARWCDRQQVQHIGR